jgi:hypothetical protein
MSVIASRIFLVLLAPLLVYAALDPALRDSQHVLHPQLLSIGVSLFHFALR